MRIPDWRRLLSAVQAPAYSGPVLLACAMMLIAARVQLPLAGDLVLDATDPVVTADIGGVRLRLRIDLDRQDSVELNPDAAAKLRVKWEDGLQMDVGRVRLNSRVAMALLHIENRVVPVQLSQHGRDCCAHVDGAIGPDLLPFVTVRWLNDHAPAPTASLALPLATSVTTGQSAAADTEGVRLRFSLGQEHTVATAAAGAILARAWNGQWSGAQGHVTAAFGIMRPSRLMTFEHPGLLAGFRFESLPVRISDFAGHETLPSDSEAAGEVVVAHGLPHQPAWPAVTIGADRLSRCAEIVYFAVSHSLVMHCAFDRP